MHFYQFNIGDYAKKTQHLSNEEDLAYRRLLDFYYDTETPILDDVTKIARRIRVDCSAVTAVLDEFFIKTEDGWINTRCEQDISAYKARAKTAKENGKKAAETRYQNGNYMAHAGHLYAVRVDPSRVKVGISGNLKSRIHQLRAKYGLGATLEYSVEVSNMGDAEFDLLQIYSEIRDGEIIPLSADDIGTLKCHMDRIAVAYGSHSGLATNQEPITNTQEVNTPKSPKGDRTQGIELKTFLDVCKQKNEKPISGYKPVFSYAESVGLPTDFIQLAWFEFCRQFGEGGVNESRKQKDWRKTFRNYVEKGYLKLWWITPEGRYELTTNGKQAQLANSERLAA